MYKHDVTYQLEDPQYVVVVSEEGFEVFRKDKSLFKLNTEQFEKLVEDYEEINR